MGGLSESLAVAAPSFTVPLALIGWIPFVLVLFALVPVRTAIIVAFVGAWLFLPVYGYKLPGMPDYSKVTVASTAVMLGILAFDAGQLSSFRFRWYDLPLAVWCTAPMASSLSMGYGVYDGIAGVVNQSIVWGLPYFIGRLYFDDLAGMRQLAIGLVIGGLIYIPFCLWEVRMSPQLHKIIYGYHQHSFAQTKRFGGFRPMVFMQHGLAVGMYMCMATLVAFWCWMSGAVHLIWKVPTRWAVAGLATTAILCKSTGSIVLLILGCGALLASRYVRTPALLAVIMCAPLGYMGARTVGGWDGHELVELTDRMSATRGGSLQFRLNSENGVWWLVRHDMIFGWARFSFAGRKVEESNDQRIIGDGMWIIALGKYGFVGLGAFSAVLLLPPVLLSMRWRAALWRHPALGPSAALAVMSALYLWDCLFNAMINPVFIMAVGGATGCCALGPGVPGGSTGRRNARVATDQNRALPHLNTGGLRDRLTG